jgi:predicted GNAT family acetyltransferase
MEIDVDSLQVTNNEADEQYEIAAGDEKALIAYERAGNRIIYLHTEVPKSLEGHGIAGRMAKHALDEARAKGWRVVPLCPYVRAYIERHPEYADLVDQP